MNFDRYFRVLSSAKQNRKKHLLPQVVNLSGPQYPEFFSYLRTDMDFSQVERINFGILRRIDTWRELEDISNIFRSAA